MKKFSQRDIELGLDVIITFADLQDAFPGYCYPPDTSLTVADIRYLPRGGRDLFYIQSTDPDGTEHRYEFEMGTIGYLEFTRDGAYWDILTPVMNTYYPGEGSYYLDADRIYDREVQATWFDAVLRDDARRQRGEPEPEGVLQTQRGAEYSEAYFLIDADTLLMASESQLFPDLPIPALWQESYMINLEKFTRLIESIDQRGLLFRAFSNSTAEHADTLKTLYISQIFEPFADLFEHFNGWGRNGEILSNRPYVSVTAEGERITGYASDFVLDFAEIEPALEQLNLEADIPNYVEETGVQWCGIRIPGTPVFLPLPAGQGAFCARYKNDGTELRIDVLDYTSGREEALAKEMRRRKAVISSPQARTDQQPKED